MKTLIFFVCFAFLFWGTTLSAAEPPGDFSGTWIPDIKKSNHSSEMVLVQNYPNNPSGMRAIMDEFYFGGSMTQLIISRKQLSSLPSVIIEQTPVSIKFCITGTVDGRSMTPMEKSFSLDKKEDVVEMNDQHGKKTAIKRTKAIIDGNKATIKIIVEWQYDRAERIHTFKLSKDSRTLVLVTTTNMGSYQVHQKILYNRQ